MKKNFTMALAAAMMTAAVFTSCSKEETSDLGGSPVKTMTFALDGDFTLSTHDFTRALTADGKDMTDVWVFDYVGDELVQQVHQTSEDDDFGTPTMSLTLGTHNIYFVASRGQSPTLNTTAKTITFTKVLDTFWKSLSVTVASGGSENRNVSLDRVVTKLKLVFSDVVPTGTSTITITPATWYYGVNYQTGAPAASASNQTVTLNIPNTSIGVVNESANVYGFSSTAEWTTSVSVVSKNGSDVTIGSASIASAPFVRNRVTEYTGSFWTNNKGMTLSLNAAWDEAYEGTW